tara:strand:- start:293692 stop:294279 length:588 start_codon:yes stop_codon:yes gene_type:complete
MSTQLKPKEHQTHRESLWRFLILLLLLVGYFGYMSWKFDASTGALLALLSWSFFVLCTPIADGGFVVAFPVRLLFGTRMVTTQIVVWVVALVINIVAVSVVPKAYSQTALTDVLYSILTTPWPNWSVLLISLAGTMLSIWFGDEMIDVTSHSMRKKHHRHGFKHKILLVVGFGLLTIFAYSHVLSGLGIDIPGSG